MTLTEALDQAVRHLDALIECAETAQDLEPTKHYVALRAGLALRSLNEARKMVG